MSKGKLTAGAIVVIAILVLGVTWLKRPRPIEFLGERPPVTVMGPGGEDWTTFIPFLRQRSPRITEKPPEGAYVGFLRWNNGVKRQEMPPYFRIGGLDMEPTYCLVSESKGESALITPIPIVNEEKNRDAVLVDGSKEWKVKLPCDPSIGGPILKPITAKAGPWILTATPDPWIASLQKLDFTLLVKGPHPATLWLGKSVGAVSIIGSYVQTIQTDVPKKMKMDVSLLWDTVAEIEPVALQFTTGDDDLLVDDKGKKWDIKAGPPPGYVALQCGASGETWWVAKLLGIDGIKPVPYIPPQIKRGTAVSAKGYRKVSENKLYMLLDVPPILNTP